MPSKRAQARPSPAQDEKTRAIEIAVAGIAKYWNLSDSEASALLRALRRRSRGGYDAQRFLMLLDIFEWLDAISRNLGGPTALLRTSQDGEKSDLEKILSGRLDLLSEVHRELAKHVYFGCSPR